MPPPPPPPPKPPPQQAWPEPPQATHILLVQRAPEAVQKVLPKLPPPHCCPMAPQGMPMRWQEPFMHIPPPPPHMVPLPWHWPRTQQPPLLQVLAAQQAWPGPPQFAPEPPAPPAAPPAPPPEPPVLPPLPPA